MILENKRLKITSTDIEQCENPQQLKVWMGEIETDIAEINAKIAAAKAGVLIDGKYADPKWFASLNSDLRFQGVLKQKCQIRLAAIKAERRPFSEFIVDVIKMRFDKDTWNQIVADAEILQERYYQKEAPKKPAT